jgi:hypothetical protein
MATATVTISRASPADTKAIDVPGFRLLTNTALTNPGLADIQDNTLQQSQANTIYGQPGHARGVSEDNAGHFSSISSESQVAIRPQSSEESSPSELPTNNAPTPPGAPAPASGPTLRKGPLSKPVELPPKPRPGRKPMPNGQANDRRKEQNRQAQRNFRDKRAMKVKELEGDLSDLKGKAETQERILTNKLHDQKQRNAALVKENEGLRRALDASNNRNSELERQIRERAAQSMANARFNASVQRVGTSSGLPPLTSQHAGVDDNIHRASSGAIVTPPIDAGYNSMFPTNDMNNNTGFEMETDFTNYLRGTNNVAQNAPQNNVDSDNMDYVHDGVTCGFCTDTSNCVCAAKSRPVVAPGGCDACVRDPERAAACKALADQTQVSQRPTEPTNNNTEHRHDSMAQPQNMISCSSLIDRLGGRRIPSIRELVPGTVHSYVPSRHPGAGYDVDEQEVAHVLQSMSGRNTEINMGL